MSKYLIKIDRKTIKKNPNAGSTVTLVPGIVDHYIDDNGNEVWERPVQRIYHEAERSYLYKYKNNIVQCNECKKRFGVNKLESDSYGYDDIYSDTICPYCGMWNCCEIEYEQFDKEMMK